MLYKKCRTNKGGDLCALLSARGGWLLSYNDSETVRELYSMYRIVKLDYAHSMGNWVKKRYGKASADELLILADDVDTSMLRVAA